MDVQQADVSMDGADSQPQEALVSLSGGDAGNPIDLPFESIGENGTLPDRPLSFVEQTFDIRYLVDNGKAGEDYWVCI